MSDTILKVHREFIADIPGKAIALAQEAADDAEALMTFTIERSVYLSDADLDDPDEPQYKAVLWVVGKVVK